MSSLTNDVTVSGDIDQALAKRIYRLFTTPAGSVPFDREFGIDINVLDNTPKAVEGALLVEYVKKLNKYFPEVKISQISFSYQGSSIYPKVVLTNA